MLSSFFTVSDKVLDGIEVQWKHSNFIAVGSDFEGVKVPVASKRKIEQVRYGTLAAAPSLRISPLNKLPAATSPHAVVLVRGYDLSLVHGWSVFALPKQLLPQGTSVSKEKPQEFGSGTEVINARERSSLLVALPPNTAVELPFLETGPKILVWLGSGKPALVHRSIIGSLKRSI